MALVVLIIHLLVCVCLIGLVLLQRSEGGALGMGGGNSGALMSGRGAADALARMTMVAGGFFLLTSFGLTILSGSANSLTTHSVFDSLPRQERTVPAPAQTLPVTPAPAQPTPARPDPTQSSAPQAATSQLASAITPGPTPASAAPLAPSANNSSARAAPITTHPPAAATTNNRPATTVPASTNTNSAATHPPATTPARTNPPAATTTPARSNNTTTANSTGRLVLPNTSGSVGGIALTDDPPINPESTDNGVQAVRRERAGPDQ